MFKKGLAFLRSRYEKLAGRSVVDPSYFLGLDKVYPASADQFKGMEAIAEGDEVLQCLHFYSVIGGLGGLNILARLRSIESVTFFDINPNALEICRFLVEVIRHAEDRDTFVSLLYGRSFDSRRYSFDTQHSFYALPVDPQWTERLRNAVDSRLFELYLRVYLPYIQDPMKDMYDGVSLHCTRLPLYHEAPIDGVMTYPFIPREEMEKRRITSVNSLFFGKGWLRSEDRYRRVRHHLRNARVMIKDAAISDIAPPQHSGLYSSNVFDGREKEFRHVCRRFTWVLWYSRRSKYLVMEYVRPENRNIPMDEVYGKGVHDPHRSCCDLLDAHFDLNRQPFLEVIWPHPTEGMEYGFRFYKGQRRVSVRDFLSSTFDAGDSPDIIGIHILMGGGCPVDTWKETVSKAVECRETVFVFEHRKECSDWPESDVDPRTILPEMEIDRFLLTLDGRWSKYGAANKRGSVKDIRNICWILRKRHGLAMPVGPSEGSPHDGSG